MRRTRFGRWLVAAALLAALPLDAGAQARQQTGTLRVVVKDPSGAVIPGAIVQVAPAAASASDAAAPSVTSDALGNAVITGLPPGRYSIEVSFPGFETAVIPDQRVRAGENRREVSLAIKKLDESVSVARRPATSASDPRSDRFSNVLSKEQIDALPDDPDEMERVLKEMAGPGGSIRVDGFRGGKLPPKAQIRSIRFGSGMFAAENHGGGMTFVDIHTQPGMGPMSGSVEFTFRDEALNARNAFVMEKAPEQSQQYGLNLSGTIVKDRTSFSLTAGGTSLYDSAYVYAADVDGPIYDTIRRPSDRINVFARVDHVLTKTHALRGTFQQNASDQWNLGVGAFDLSDRGFRRTSSEKPTKLIRRRTVPDRKPIPMRGTRANTIAAPASTTSETRPVATKKERPTTRREFSTRAAVTFSVADSGRCLTR